MSMKDAVGEYAALMADVATLAKYNLDCDTARDAARDDAVFDQLHGDKEKRPTQAAEDNEPPMPRVDMNIELALLCAAGGEYDPFEKDWDRLSDELDKSDCTNPERDGIERRHGEFVAACSSGNWHKVEQCAKRLAAYLLEAANAAERKSRDGYTEADRKREKDGKADNEQKPATNTRRATTVGDRHVYAVYKNLYMAESQYKNCKTDKSKKRGPRQFYNFFKNNHVVCGEKFSKTLGERYSSVEDFERAMDAVRKNNKNKGIKDNNKELLSRGEPKVELKWRSAIPSA